MKNFLYIHTHDCGRYFSPYGYAVPTPNLMGFSQSTLLFRNAYCTCPTCCPSRVGMLSGMTPHSSGMLGLSHRGFRMEDYHQHLSHYLRSQGFYTALSGVQHEARPKELLGYEAFLDRCDGDDDRASAEAAANFLLNAPKDRPFFLSFGMGCTHRTYPEDIRDINPNNVMPPFPVPDNAANRQDTARYMRAVQIADECAGVVLDALKKSGLEKDTVVMFTTDHGLPLPRMKSTLYDTGLGVALMMRVPGSSSMGKATDSLISQVDVFPTLCDLLDIPRPDWLQGKSFVSLFENPDIKINEEIFGELNYHASYEPVRCIRTENFKLICFFDIHSSTVSTNIDRSPAKDQMLAAGWKNRWQPRELLFDLRLDPVERENLIGMPEYLPVYNDLLKRLESWMQRTDDPLLQYRYRIPAPEGTRVNPSYLDHPNFIDFE